MKCPSSIGRPPSVVPWCGQRFWKAKYSPSTFATATGNPSMETVIVSPGAR
jgi:hypothetical protein